MHPKLTITNRSNATRPLWIEPDGADYWMQPEQTFDVIAENDDPDGVFEIWDDGKGIQVFGTAAMGYLSVMYSDKLIECGYQRPINA